jgi:putative inorganic carbon (hco3(-)) transporter
VRNESILQRVMRDNVVAIVVAMVLLVPLIAPISQNVKIWRNALFQGLSVLLLLSLLARWEWHGGLGRFWALMRSGITLPLLLYVGWASLAVFRAPYRAFSVNELLMHGAGVVICLVVSWHVTSRSQLRMLCTAVVLILVLTLFFSIFIQDSPGEVGLRSSFGSRMLFGGFLALLTPFVTALAVAAGLRTDDSARGRQLFLRVVAALAGLGLVLTQCRSAWTGGLIGLLLFTALVARSRRPSRIAGDGTGSAYVLVAVVLSGAILFGFGPASDLLRHRVGTIGDAAHGGDESFNWRVTKWREALPLIAARPLTGWGLGSYPFHPAPSAGPGAAPAVVASAGVSLDEQAHNEYIQMTAELGLVGLTLYLLIFLSFFAKAWHAIRRLPHGQRQLVLMGCMAGVAAQMVDAVGNPAWRFPQCSLFLWLLLGMGVACIRMAYEPQGEARRPRRRGQLQVVSGEPGQRGQETECRV